ncbi:MAG TPA: transglutaminase-like domain-containing protein [Burkholderiales bacterium]
MSLPPLLLVAAMALWAWQTGFWLPALAAAALLEGARFSARRWRFDDQDLNRFFDFCAALAGGATVLFYFSYGNPRAVILLFEWLPLVLLPLALVLVWSGQRVVTLSVLFWGLRRQGGDRRRTINAGYPYFAVWLLAASAANQRGLAFYVAVCVLLAWPLLLRRPRGAGWFLPAAMLALAMGVGYGLQLGLSGFQNWMEGAVPEWLSASGSRTDPYRSSTDFGEVGRLKESDGIVMRVVMQDGQKPPLLLRRASYDLYSGGTWIARNGKFTVLDGTGTAWPLAAQVAQARVWVHDFSASGNPVLALPAGSVRVSGLKAASLKRNPLGAVQAEAPPGSVDYEVEYAPGAPEAAPPDENDLRLPAAEEAVLHKVAAQAGLSGLAPAPVMQRLREYFARNFSYSLYQDATPEGHTPLSAFLLSTHSGHCEYFATAAVLLARAAGVPARYATGFSVLEYSALEGAYVVRERHAHAWAQLYVDGQWRDLDTTPPTWVSAEGLRAPRYAPLLDVISWARFALSRWLAGLSDAQLYGGAGVMVLAGLWWLARGTLRSRRKPGSEREASGHAGDAAAQTPSPFRQIEARLATSGLLRGQTRTVLDWVESLAGRAELEPEVLRRFAWLHYRLRYDPAGLNAQAQAAFAQDVAGWLERHPPQGGE